MQGIRGVTAAVMLIPLQRKSGMYRKYGRTNSESEESEMSEPPRLKSTEYSVSMKRGSEMSELNAVGRTNRMSTPERGRGGGKRGGLFYTQRHRAR